MARIPIRVLDVALGSRYQKNEITEAVDAFLVDGDERPYFFLLGRPGCGKTVAAAIGVLHWKRSVMVHLDDEEIAVDVHPSWSWTRGIDLIRAGTFDKDYWREIENVELLVIDDLGAEPSDAKGFGKANLLNLLSYRESMGHKTIITSNANFALLKEHYLSGPGERILDRMNVCLDETSCVYEIDSGSLRGGKR